jgi:hypothetical protein
MSGQGFPTLDLVCRFLVPGQANERFELVDGVEEALNTYFHQCSGRPGAMAALEELLQLVVALRKELRSPTCARILLEALVQSPAGRRLLAQRKPCQDAEAKRRRFDAFSDRVERALPVAPACAAAPGTRKLSSVYNHLNQMGSAPVSRSGAAPRTEAHKRKPDAPRAPRGRVARRSIRVL